MKLEDTISLMTSDDFRDKTKAEYLQLKIRHEGLMITHKYKFVV